MVEARIRKKLKACAYCPALWVIRAINEARNACLYHRTRAHAAGLNGNVKSSARKPVVAEDACCFAQNDYFRVRGRVAVPHRAVTGPGDYPPVMHQHRANGYFLSSRCGAGLFEGLLHEGNIAIRHGSENSMQNKKERSRAECGSQADCLTIACRRNKLFAMRELLGRLFQIDFIKGLAVTFRMQNPKEIVTEQYPLERPMVAERYRGAPRLNNNPETGETLCIGCNLCALACPENLIVVGWLRDDATRRKVLTHFTYDTSRCMFCGLCEDACPTDALELTQDFEMAYYTREGAIWDRHRLEQGPTPARYTR